MGDLVFVSLIHVVVLLIVLFMIFLKYKFDRFFMLFLKLFIKIIHLHDHGNRGFINYSYVTLKNDLFKQLRPNGKMQLKSKLHLF